MDDDDVRGDLQRALEAGAVQTTSERRPTRSCRHSDARTSGMQSRARSGNGSRDDWKFRPLVATRGWKTTDLVAASARASALLVAACWGPAPARSTSGPAT